MSEPSGLLYEEAAPGLRVRQEDWMLRPGGYRDGVIVELAEPAQGTRHGWVFVEFDPQPYNPSKHTLRVSTGQLKQLEATRT